MADKGMKQNTL